MPQPDQPRILVWPATGPDPFDVAADLMRLVPSLAEHGIVVIEPDQDRLRQLVQDPRPTVIVTSTPIHEIPTDLGVPVIPVVGWPYDRIPAAVMPWDRPPFDHCIALNSATVAVLERDLAGAVTVQLALAPAVEPATERPDVITVPGVVVDSNELEITEATIRHSDPTRLAPGDAWDGSPLWLRFSLTDDDRGLLVGFYNSEVWGTWSRIRDPWVLLPRTVSGDIRLSLDAHGFAGNAGRRVQVTLGGASGWVELPERHDHLIVEFRGVRPTNVLQFHDLDVSNAGTSTDIRTMGVALGSVRLTRPGVWSKVRDRLGWRRSRPVTESTTDVLLAGVVYLAVADPRDELSNWSQLITAFGMAFRDEPQATLVLQLPDAPLAAFFAELQLTLHRIGGFACRVVVLTGHLNAAEQARLYRRADYFCTAAMGAASAVATIDAMAAQTPLIAPDHTAFGDLGLPETGWRVPTTAGPRGWPGDVERPIVVLAQRPDFDSLVACLRESFRVAATDRPAWRQLAERAGRVAPRTHPQLAAVISGAVDARV